MNWKHSLYEIYASSIGQAFIVDEAYRILHEFREDRLFAIASAYAESARARAKVIDAKKSLKDFEARQESQSNRYRAEAFILETEARFLIAQPCLDMARVELAFIELLIERIESSGSLLFANQGRAAAAQLVQPHEFAYEYGLLYLLDGPSSDLLRNIWAHPNSAIIMELVQSEHITNEFSHSKFAKALADRLNIAEQFLAITVKDSLYTAIADCTTSGVLDKYIEESNNSLKRLSEIKPA